MSPTRYEPSLDVSLEEDTFEGEVTIELAIEQPTQTIELHARGLDPREAELSTGEDRLEPEIETHPQAQRWTLGFGQTLEPGQATLTIGYEGELGEDMTGLYRSEAGAQRCLVTQCEPSHARAVFPCFDEPSFKAEIAWRVRADEELTVLANGAQDEEITHEDGTSTRIFEATPPISSYLAAVAVGDFEASEPVERDGVPFRVWALDGAEQLGERARDKAAELMGFYERFFEQPYPYGKYDQLAVPSFSFGAMENVGLVVFRRSLLLLDRDKATWDETKAVDRVVAHELAHMWFGNLVTMAWWDDLWLNEAFAEWIAHEAVDELEPEHEIWHAFRARTDQALETDALDSTHAIYHPVETPAEAMEMFDQVTYGKGSAVMRMLAAYLGEDSFQQGLASYLDAFAEGNATGQQLWDHLAKASDQPVADVMRAWITQPGHPCVSVELSRETEDGVELALAQDRHRQRRSTTLQKPTWPVPIVLRYADSAGIHEDRFLLEESSGSVELDVDGELAWCIANAGQEGFYRVDHGDELEARLVDHARELSPAERWGLVRDSFAFVKAGEREVREHGRLLDELATGSSHFAFVDDVVGHLRELEGMLEAHGDEQALQGLQAWTRRTFGPAVEELGAQPVPGEAPPRRQRRATVLAAQAAIGHDEDALEQARELAETERADPSEVDPELATAAVRIAARHGDHERFEAYVDTYEARRDEGASPQQVQRYLRSLVLFREEDSIAALLGMIEDGDVPAQSVGPLLESGLSQPHAQRQLVDFVAGNHDELQARVGTAWIARIVEALGQVQADLVPEVRELLEGPLGEVAPESTERARERLEQTTELAEAGVAEELAAWAREQG